MKKIVPVAIMIMLISIVGMFPAVNADESISVVDARGVEVTLEAPPERIVSYMASNTETLFHIGVGDRVVGVDHFSNYPPEVDGLPKVGDLEHDTEQILYLEPDLVVAASYNTALIEDMEQHGVPVFATSSTTYQDIFDDMRMLGEICGVKETADLLATDLEEKIDDITKNVPQEDRPSVLYVTDTSGGIHSVGNHTFIHTLLDRAGFENIAADKDGWITYNEEDIIAENPDVIITSESMKDSLEAYIGKRSWRNITAVELDQVYHVDDDLISRPGPRVVQIQETLVEIAEEAESGDEDEEIPGFTASTMLVTATAAAFVVKKWKDVR